MKMNHNGVCRAEQQLEKVLWFRSSLGFLIVFFYINLNFITNFCLAGPPDSVFDWTREIDSDFTNQNSNNQAFSRKYWRLLQCQNGG